MKALTFLVFLVSSTCLAGFEGHGGGVFVCRNSHFKIKKGPLAVELVDLWEGSSKFNLKIKRDDVTPIEKQIDNVLPRLKQMDFQLFYTTSVLLGRLQFSKIKIPLNAMIAPPTDLNAGFWKRGCPPEGLATYSDASEEVHADEDLMSHMSKTDIAAFRVHEALCRALRSPPWNDGFDTNRCRRLVGIIFSSQKIYDFSDQAPNAILNCGTRAGPLFSFDVLSDRTLRFKVIDGNYLIEKKDIRLADDLFEALTTMTPHVYLKLGTVVDPSMRRYFQQIEYDGKYENYKVSLSYENHQEFEEVSCSSASAVSTAQ